MRCADNDASVMAGEISPRGADVRLLQVEAVSCYDAQAMAQFANSEATMSTLKERRIALYLTRRDLAGLSGVTVRTIYSAESGQRNPSAITCRRLEDALAKVEAERATSVTR